MNTAATDAQHQDFTCGAFDADGVPADAGSLRRFLVGRDAQPVAMDPDELARELNDPLATLLFRQGRFPGTAEALLAELDAVVGAAQELGRETQFSFVVAEGSQVAKDPSNNFNRRPRFVVTRGRGAEGPDVIVVAFQPTGPLVEAVAWDDVRGGFNYYRTVGDNRDRGAWVWAGNSRHAFEPDTRARGPFESHPTGNVIMRELKFPWVHWASPKARMDERDFAAGDPRANHEWFRDEAGAYVLEESVVKPGITRWNRRRLDALAEAGTLDDAVPLFEQLLGSPDNKHHTVNLVSSPDSSADAVNDVLRLPLTFFVDFDGLSGVLGLEGPRAALATPGAVYRDALAKFGVVVRNEDAARSRPEGEDLFERAGDTHFAFVVPERAFEDVDFLAQLVAHPVGLVTRRLAACLLMVDFSNPVFSDVRASLIGHVPPGPITADRWPGFSQELGDRIAAAAGGAPDGAPELEFAALWQRGEDGWRNAANQLLLGYYGALSDRVGTTEGFEGYFRLAEARRNRVRQMMIDETPLLFAQTNLPADDLRNLAMARDGTVAVRGAAA